LQVTETASYAQPWEGFGLTTFRATLCYQHGTSRRLCASSWTGMWTVRLLSGRDQFLTLQLGGKTVARVVYRSANISGPPARAEVPAVWSVGLTGPTTTYAPGGLNGPQSLRIGTQAFFWGTFGPHTLCYKHGSSAIRCRQSRFGGFYVDVLPGRDQYVTLRRSGEVISRLVYLNVT
jgi:hypothetical protein